MSNSIAKAFASASMAAVSMCLILGMPAYIRRIAILYNTVYEHFHFHGFEVLQKTLRTYFRPEPRCSQKAQDTAVKKFDGRIIAYTDLAEWFGDMRRGELVGVPFFHRIATDAESLKAARDSLKDKGVVLIELDTGRRTDNPTDYADMVDEARDFYSRRGFTKAEVQRIAKMGAAASPVTKSKADERLPVEIVEKILNDHETYQTLRLAFRAINNAKNADGKKFKRKWYPALVSRLANPKKGPPKINLKPRRSGPKVKM